MDEKPYYILGERKATIEERLKNLEEKLLELVLSLHDTIATDCLLPPDRCRTFLDNLSNMFQELDALIETGELVKLGV